MQSFTTASLKGQGNVEKVQYYREFTDDVVSTKNPDYQIPEDYVWVRESRIFRFLSALCYGAVWITGLIYCKAALHMRIKGRKVLAEYRGTGFFLYANHTQPFGDVVMPAYVSGRKRIYTIVSPENMGIPVIGTMLPALGALPVPEGISQMKLFIKAVDKRVAEGNGIVIYPEAHVWPYYTRIRKFPDTSFHFPVENRVPSFAMTVTYQKRKVGKRPKTTIYVDGPFWPADACPKREQRRRLADEIRTVMEQRSLESTYEYIVYQRVGE